MDIINKLNNTIEDILIDNYINMIKNDKKELINNILSTIPKEIELPSNINIETIIDKHLGIELEYNGLHTINMLFEDLQDLSKSIMIKIDKEIYEKEKCYEIYIQEIKKSLLRNQMQWFDDLSSNFINEFIKELEILTKYSEEKKETIKKNLNNIMSKYKIKFNQSYQKILKDYISNKIQEMKKEIQQSKITRFEYPKLKKYHQIIELSNYELIKENNIYYAKNKKTKEQSELIFEEIKLKTKDNKIIFIIDEYSKHQGFKDNEKNISVIVTNNRIDIAIDINKENNQDKKIITIVKVEQKYQFYYNNKLIKKIENIEKILNIIIKYTPEIYNKLLINLYCESSLVENNKFKEQKNTKIRK